MPKLLLLEWNSIPVIQTGRKEKGLFQISYEQDFSHVLSRGS
jgi:hypothetical protein